jgi:Leucine Rich repeats (2 copies)/Pentapeptide repeats (8 copies)
MILNCQIPRGVIAILEAPQEDDFSRLVSLSGLDPGVAFRRADLTDVDFGTANLAGYDFSGANLTRAKLRRARGTTQLKFDAATIWPTDWYPDIPRYDYSKARHMILNGQAPPVEWLPFIVALDFAGHSGFSDLTPIAGITALQRLDLSRTGVTDLGPLKSLVGLRHLNLSLTKVRDISPLASLVALENLQLVRCTQLHEINHLAGLVALQELDLWGTQVTELTSLVMLPLLRHLDIRCSAVTDVTPLYGIRKLRIDQ